MRLSMHAFSFHLWWLTPFVGMEVSMDFANSQRTFGMLNPRWQQRRLQRPKRQWPVNATLNKTNDYELHYSRETKWMFRFEKLHIHRMNNKMLSAFSVWKLCCQFSDTDQSNINPCFLYKKIRKHRIQQVFFRNSFLCVWLREIPWFIYNI